MCGCKVKWGALALVAIVAAIAVVVAVRRGRGGDGAEVQQEQQADNSKLSAAERTQAKIEERMADTNYVAGLEALAKRGDELNALREEAREELAALKALADGGGDEAVKAAEEKLAKIDEAIDANRRIAEDFIAARLQQQGEKGMEAERAAAAAGRKDGKAAPRPGAEREAWRRLPPGVEPPNTNRLEKAAGI